MCADTHIHIYTCTLTQPYMQKMLCDIKGESWAGRPTSGSSAPFSFSPTTNTTFPQHVWESQTFSFEMIFFGEAVCHMSSLVLCWSLVVSDSEIPSSGITCTCLSLQSASPSQSPHQQIDGSQLLAENVAKAQGRGTECHALPALSVAPAVSFGLSLELSPLQRGTSRPILRTDPRPLHIPICRHKGCSP